MLSSTRDFIKNNTKTAWRKTPAGRIDNPEYAERAYFEAIVNALIHRNYFEIGSEIHIDIYDNRLTIWSPRGMMNGSIFTEQPIFKMESNRRNPVIAGIFQRIHLMERRGSGFSKIIEATKNLPTYTENFIPKFEANSNGFRITLWNVNYTAQDTAQDKIHRILEFCKTPKSRAEIMEHLNLVHSKHFRKKYLLPLLNDKKIRMTIPDKPSSKNQKYLP